MFSVWMNWFLCGGVTVPEEKLDWMRAEQLRAYMDMIPACLAGLIPLSLVLVANFWGGPPWPILFAFIYSVSVISFLMLRFYVKWRRHAVELEGTNIKATLNRISFNAAIGGIVWGMMLSLLTINYPQASDTMMAAVTIGFMACGAFMLSMMPRAALVYTSAVAMGYLGSHASRVEGLSLLDVVTLMTVVLVLQRSVAWYYASFVRQRLDNRKLEESGEVISLLLHDFEANASDWLWDLDADGRLVRVSTRFAEAVNRSREELEGGYLVDYFVEDHAQRFQQLIENRLSFRNEILSLEIDGQLRWWSISARPRFVANGGQDTFFGYRGVCRDVTQEQNAEARIAFLAHFDVLTGVANRAYFARELDEAVRQLHESGEPFALHTIDLDNFKSINDQLGHLAGDELLKIVAERLKQSVSSNDLVGRQGGDEFVVLQRGVTHEDDATFLSDCIIDALLDPVKIGRRRQLVTGSVGVALAPEDGADSHTLLKHADLALYCAKKSGRGCARRFMPSMDAEARRRARIENELRRAMHEDQLELYFQPLIDVETMEVKGYESLLRWWLPSGEMIMPTEFITIAEESGLIVPLGEWVIRTAIREAAKWPEHVTVAVNLSPAQMSNPSLTSTVVQAIGAAQIDPARVELEITESVLMEESDTNLKTLHALKNIGCRIALDDFGTGYSSLSYLRAFPFDKIKIDKSFVSELETRSDCRAIVGAVMRLASALKMRTTAEGVETSVRSKSFVPKA